MMVMELFRGVSSKISTKQLKYLKLLDTKLIKLSIIYLNKSDILCLVGN